MIVHLEDSFTVLRWKKLGQDCGGSMNVLPWSFRPHTLNDILLWLVDFGCHVFEKMYKNSWTIKLSFHFRKTSVIILSVRNGCEVVKMEINHVYLSLIILPSIGTSCPWNCTRSAVSVLILRSLWHTWCGLEGLEKTNLIVIMNVLEDSLVGVCLPSSPCFGRDWCWSGTKKTKQKNPQRHQYIDIIHREI